METLKCIHNALTVGIFVLFVIICILVNKCCVVYGDDENRRKCCTCHHVEITGEITPSNNIIVKTPGQPTVKAPLYEYLKKHAGKPSPSCEGCCIEGNICESCTNLHLEVIHAPLDASERSALLKVKPKGSSDESEDLAEESLRTKDLDSGAQQQIEGDDTHVSRTVRPSHDDLHVEGSLYELKSKQSRDGLSTPTVTTKVKVPLDESFSRTTPDGKSATKKQETAHDDNYTATRRESRSETNFSNSPFGSVAGRRSKSQVDSLRSGVGKTYFAQNMDDNLLTSRPATAQSTIRDTPSFRGSTKSSSSKTPRRSSLPGYETERRAPGRRSSLQPGTSRDEDEYAKPEVTTTRIDDNKFLTKVRKGTPSSKKSSDKDGTLSEDGKVINSDVIRDPTIIDRSNVLKKPSFFEKDAARNLYNQMNNQETNKSAVLSKPGYKTFDSSPDRRKPNETTFVYDKDKGKYIAVPLPDNPESCAMYCDNMVSPICRPSEDQGTFLPDIQPEVSSRKRPLSLEKNTPPEKVSSANIPNKKVKRVSTDSATLEDQLKTQDKPKIIPCSQVCSFTTQNREIISYDEADLEGKIRYEEDISNPHKVSSHPNRRNTVRDSHHLVGNKISHFYYVADHSKRTGKKKGDRSYDSANEVSRAKQTPDQRNTDDDNIPPQAIDKKSRSSSSKMPTLDASSANSVISGETFKTSTKPGDDTKQIPSTESKNSLKKSESKSEELNEDKKYTCMEKPILVPGKGKTNGSDKTVEYKKIKKVNISHDNSKNKGKKHSTTFKETVKAPKNVEVLSLTTVQSREEEMSRLYEQYAPKLAQCCKDYVKKHLNIDERDASTDKSNENVDDLKTEKVLTKGKEKQSKKQDDANLSDDEFVEDDGEHGKKGRCTKSMKKKPAAAADSDTVNISEQNIIEKQSIEDVEDKERIQSHDKRRQSKHYDKDTKSMSKGKGKRSNKQDDLNLSDYELDEDDEEQVKQRQSRSYDEDSNSMTKKKGSRSKKQDDLNLSDYEFDEDDEHVKKRQSRSYDEDSKSMTKKKGSRSKKQDDLNLSDQEFYDEYDKRFQITYVGDDGKLVTFSARPDFSEKKIEIKNAEKRPEKENESSLSDDESDADDKRRQSRSEEDKKSMTEKGKRRKKRSDLHLSTDESSENNKILKIIILDGDDTKSLTMKKGKQSKKQDLDLSDDKSSEFDGEHDEKREIRNLENAKSMAQENRKRSKNRVEDESDKYKGEHDKSLQIRYDDDEDISLRFSTTPDQSDSKIEIKKTKRRREREKKPSLSDNESDKSRYYEEEKKSMTKEKGKRSKKQDDLHLSDDKSDKRLKIRYNDADEMSVSISTTPDLSNSKIEIRKTEKWPERETNPSISDEESEEDDKKHVKSRYYDDDKKSMTKKKGTRGKKRGDLQHSDDKSGEYDGKYGKKHEIKDGDTKSMAQEKRNRSNKRDSDDKSDKKRQISYNDTDEISVIISTTPDLSNSKIEIKKTEKWPDRETNPSLSDEESEEDDKKHVKSRYNDDDKKSMPKKKGTRGKKRGDVHPSDDKSGEYVGEYDNKLQISCDNAEEISVIFSTPLDPTKPSLSDEESNKDDEASECGGELDNIVKIIILDGDNTKSMTYENAKRSKKLDDLDQSGEYDGEYEKKRQIRYESEDTKSTAQERGKRSKKQDDLHFSDSESGGYDEEYDKKRKIRYEGEDTKSMPQETRKRSKKQDGLQFSDNKSDGYDEEYGKKRQVRYEGEDTKSIAQERGKRSKKRDNLDFSDNESDEDDTSVRFAPTPEPSGININRRKTGKWPETEEETRFLQRIIKEIVEAIKKYRKIRNSQSVKGSKSVIAKTDSDLVSNDSLKQNIIEKHPIEEVIGKSTSRYKQDNQSLDISHAPADEKYDKERRAKIIPLYQTTSTYSEDEKMGPFSSRSKKDDQQYYKPHTPADKGFDKETTKKTRDMDDNKIKKPVVTHPDSDDSFEKIPTEEERRKKKRNLPQDKDKTVTGDSLSAENKVEKKQTNEVVKVLYSYDKRTGKQEEIYIQFSDEYDHDEISGTSSGEKETKNAKIEKTKTYTKVKDKKIDPKQPRTRKDILLGKKSISSEPSIVSSELVVVMEADILLDKKNTSSSVTVISRGNTHPYVPADGEYDQERRETRSQTKINIDKPSSVKKELRGKKAKIILSVEHIPGEDDQEVGKKSKTEKNLKKQQKNSQNIEIYQTTKNKIVPKQPRTRKDVLPVKKPIEPELSSTVSETISFNEELDKTQEQKVRKAPRTRKDLPANKNVTRLSKEKEPSQRGETIQQTRILIDTENKPHSVIVESRDNIQPHGMPHDPTDGELDEERRKSRRKPSSTNELLCRFLSVLGIPIQSISRLRGQSLSSDMPYSRASEEVDQERSESTSKLRPVLGISISSTTTYKDGVPVSEKEPNVTAGTDTETDELLEQQILEKVRMTESFKEYMTRRNVVTAEIGTDTSMDELIKQYIREKMKDDKEKEPKVQGTSATDTEVDYLLDKYNRKKQRLKKLTDAKSKSGKESYKSVKISVVTQKSDPEKPCRKEVESKDYILTLPHNTPIESLSLDDIEYIFSRALDAESDEPSEKCRNFSFMDDIPSSSEELIDIPDDETSDQERKETSSVYSILYKFLSILGISIPSISHLREMSNVSTDKNKKETSKQARIPRVKIKQSLSVISVSEPSVCSHRQDTFISADDTGETSRQTSTSRDKVIHYSSEISISEPSERETRTSHDKINKSCSVICIFEPSKQDKQSICADKEIGQEKRETRISRDKLIHYSSEISISEPSTSRSRQDKQYICADKEVDKKRRESSTQTRIIYYSSEISISEPSTSRSRQDMQKLNKSCSAICISESSTCRSKQDKKYNPADKKFDKKGRESSTQTRISRDKIIHYSSEFSISEPSTCRSRQDMPNISVDKKFDKKGRESSDKIIHYSSEISISEPSTSRSRQDMQNIPVDKKFDKERKVAKRQTRSPRDKLNKSCSAICVCESSTSSSRQVIYIPTDDEYDQDEIEIIKQTPAEEKLKIEIKASSGSFKLYDMAVIYVDEDFDKESKETKKHVCSCAVSSTSEPSTSRSRKDIQPSDIPNVPSCKKIDKEERKSKRKIKTPLQEKKSSSPVAGKTEPSTSRSKKEIHDLPNVPDKKKRKTKIETKTPLQEKNSSYLVSSKSESSTSQVIKNIPPPILATNKDFNKEKRKTKRETKTPLQEKNSSNRVTDKTVSFASRPKKDIHVCGKDYCKEKRKIKGETETPVQEKNKSYAVASKSEPSTSQFKKDIPNVATNKEFDKEKRKTNKVTGKTEPSTSRSGKDIQPYGMSNKEKKTKTPLQENDISYAEAGKTKPSSPQSSKDMPNVPINKELNKEKKLTKTPLQEKNISYAEAGKTKPSTPQSSKDMPNVPINKELNKEKKITKTSLEEKNKYYAVADKTEPSISRSKDKSNVSINKEFNKEKKPTKTPLQEKNKSYAEDGKTDPSTSQSKKDLSNDPKHDKEKRKTKKGTKAVAGVLKPSTSRCADKEFDKDKKGTKRKTRFNSEDNRYYSIVDQNMTFLPTDENLNKETREARTKTKIPLDERNKSCPLRGKSEPVTSRSKCTTYVPIENTEKKKCSSLCSKSVPSKSRSTTGKNKHFSEDEEFETLEFVEVFPPNIMPYTSVSEIFYKERVKPGNHHDKIVKIFPQTDESKPSTSQSNECIQRHHKPAVESRQNSRKKPVLKTLYPQDDGAVSTTSRSKEGLYPYYSPSIPEYHSNNEEVENAPFKDQKLKKCFCRKEAKERRTVDVENKNYAVCSKSEPVTTRSKKNMQQYTPILPADEFDKRTTTLYKKHSFYSESSESKSYMYKENIPPYDVSFISVDEERRQNRRKSFLEEETFECHNVASSDENLRKAPFMRKLMEDVCPEVEISATSIQGQIKTVKKGKQGFVIGKDGRIIKCTCRKKGSKKRRCICKKKHRPSRNERVIKITERVATKDEIKVEPLPCSTKTCFEKLPSYEKVSYAETNFGNFKPCKCIKTTRNYNIYTKNSGGVSSKITSTPDQEQTSIIRIRTKGCSSSDTVKTYKVTSKINITSRQQASIEELTDSLTNTPLLRIRIFKDDSHQPCPVCSVSKPTPRDKIPCVYLNRLRKDKVPTTFYNTWSSNIASTPFDSHPTSCLTGTQLISSRVAAILAKYHKPLEDNTGTVCPEALQGKKMFRYFSDGPSTSNSPTCNMCPPKKHYCIPIPPDYNAVMRVYSPIVIPKSDSSLKSIYVRGKKKKNKQCYRVCKCKNLHPKRPTVSNDAPSTSRAPDP